MERRMIFHMQYHYKLISSSISRYYNIIVLLRKTTHLNGSDTFQGLKLKLLFYSKLALLQ